MSFQQMKAIENSIDAVKEEAQLQNIAYQLYQGKERTNQDKQYKKAKEKQSNQLAPSTPIRWSC